MRLEFYTSFTGTRVVVERVIQHEVQPSVSRPQPESMPPMHTCALASFSSDFSILEATAIEQGSGGGSFSLRETRFIGRWAIRPVGMPRLRSRLPQGSRV